MKTVFLVCRNPAWTRRIEKALAARFSVSVFTSMSAALDQIYNAPPRLIVASLAPEDLAGAEMLRHLKADPMFHSLPVLAVLPDAFVLDDPQSWFMEDFIRISEPEADLQARAALCIARSERTVEMNPLTGLPGNISINREIQGRIDRRQAFAFGYVDLDHFKPFNDRYGFSRGDEVIKMTARILLGIVRSRQPQGSFVGHIGGDDFVFIVDAALAEETAGDIIRAFDGLIDGLYDPADIRQGFISSLDRRGKETSFPVMTISIGLADTRHRTFSHYGEITGVAAELKAFAKRFNGSCFKIDRRQAGPPAP